MVSSTSKWIFMTLNKHSHRVTNTYFITTRVGKKTDTNSNRELIKKNSYI